MKKALFLIDIQNDYFPDGKMQLVGADSACKNAKKLLDFFRKEQYPIAHIQHIATREDANFFLPNTYGAEIHSLLQPLNNEKVVIKHFPNSFRKTDLLNWLQNSQCTDLVICGMMTHMCIDASVRAAKDYGFSIELISDACATKDLYVNGEQIKAQDVHNSFLAALSYYYTKLVTTNEFLNNINL